MTKKQNNRTSSNPKNKNIRGKILLDTAAIIDGERNVDYGEPFDDFTTTAKFWQTYIERIISRRGGLMIEAHDVAALMMLLKTARLTWTADKKDHWMDAVGYAACGWECVEKEIQEHTEAIKSHQQQKNRTYINDLHKRAGLQAKEIKIQ